MKKITIEEAKSHLKDLSLTETGVTLRKEYYFSLFDVVNSFEGHAMMKLAAFHGEDLTTYDFLTKLGHIGAMDEPEDDADLILETLLKKEFIILKENGVYELAPKTFYIVEGEN